MEQGKPYWYPEMSEAGLLALHALRDYVATDYTMRKAAGKLMDLNVTDMTALRRIITAQRQGNPVSPSELAVTLGFSTASITKTVDKLVRHGYAERISDEFDRRALRIISTDKAHRDVRDEMAVIHEEMAQVVAEFSAAELTIIHSFIAKQTEVLSRFVQHSEQQSGNRSSE